MPKFLEKVGLHRPQLRAWALYDFANSAFATTILSAVLPIFYADVAAADLEPHLRTAYWGYTAGAGLAAVVLLAPLIGAMADLLGAKKKFLLAFMSAGVAASALLATVGQGEWLWCSIIFLIGQVGFAGGNVFYDSLLPHIVGDDDGELDRVSTAGFAVGYLGGGILLAINLAWIMKPDWFGFTDAGVAVKASFLSVAVWWALFSIPIFLKVPEPPFKKRANVNLWSGFVHVKNTIASLPTYKNLLIFLVAFWFYNDGIGTIIKMATIFGREIGIGKNHLIGALLLVQFVGVPFTFLFGRIASHLGAKGGLYVCLGVYTFICFLGYFMHHAWQFWALAVLVALVQGGAQGLSRSIFAGMIPKSRSAEFFSFFSVSGKFAGIFGPLIFGVISQATGGSRNSILFLVVFFFIGMVLLKKVDIKEGQAQAERSGSIP